MERVKLRPSEIAKELRSLKDWRAEDDMLKRRYKFTNFAEALDFVNKVGEVAEATDHHPDITFGWGYAEITYTTHDRGGITDVDFANARKVNELRVGE